MRKITIVALLFSLWAKTLPAQAGTYPELELILDASATLEFAIPALPGSISVNSEVEIPVYIRDLGSQIGAYDCEISVDPSLVDLLAITPADNATYSSANFTTIAQPTVGSHRVTGWTASPSGYGNFVHAFSISVRVLSLSADNKLTLGWRNTLTPLLKPLYGDTVSLTIQSGALLGDIGLAPAWRSDFQSWATGYGLPDEPLTMHEEMQVSQLLAYAMGWVPNDPTTWEKLKLDSGNGFKLVFTRSKTVLPTWRFQRSPDLSAWYDFEPDSEQVEPISSSQERVTVTVDSAPDTEAEFFKVFIQP